MGILEKVKKFFYEEEIEEDDEDEVAEQEEKPKKIAKTRHKERTIVLDEDDKDISERELFKAERTFNFPMDIGDEDEETNSEPLKKEEPKTTEEKFVPLRRYNAAERENAYTGIRSYASYEPSVKTEPKREEKKFKPTPVISPIYGVLDKNYKKEDIIKKNEETYETPKKLDYDTIRRKAYKDVYEEEKEEQKGIFFNLDEKDKEEDFSSEDDVKIIYNDVTFEDQEDNVEDTSISEEDNIPDVNIDDEVDNNEEIESDIEDIKKEVDDDDDDKILSESNEDDLFNLIDNMYNSDDDDEEDEE